jgi:hypothetical protein
MRGLSGLILGLLATAVLATGAEAAARAPAEPTYAALDPRGEWPDVQRIPLSARLPTLKGKRIYLVKSWPSNSGFVEVTAKLAETIKARYPDAVVTIKDRNVRYSEDDPALWAEMKERADAFIYIVAASSSTTSYAFKWSAKLEKMGLPGVVVNFDSLNSVGGTTNAREGADVRRATFHYPPEAMDKNAYDAAIDATLQALTDPLKPAETRTGVVKAVHPPEVAATGTLQQIQETFYDKGLTDGLPIIPPTRERLAAMLKGTSHSPDEVVAPAFMPESLRATVRKVALNGIMAGCGPEHMPVLLATVEAFQKFNLNSMLRSTNSFSFMQVVNGPIRNQLKMNAATNAVGPGNRSNSCMGRALRLFIVNLGGGVPDVNLMAVIGNVTSQGFMFAENEEMSPWEPLSADHGFKRGDNTLTLLSGGWAHAGNYGLGTSLADVPGDLARFQLPSGAIVIISPARAAELKAKGMTKQQVRDYLFDNAYRTLGQMREGERFRETDATRGKPDSTRIPVFQPGTIDVVVVGNDASPMMQAWHMYRPQTVSIDKWR